MEEKNVNVTAEEQVEETVDQTVETEEAGKPAAVEKEPNFFEKHPKITLAAKVAGGVVLGAATIYGGVKITKVIFNKKVAQEVARVTAETVAPVIETVTDPAEMLAEAAKDAGVEVVQF